MIGPVQERCIAAAPRLTLRGPHDSLYEENVVLTTEKLSIRVGTAQP